jgi:putative addiction module killer protein
MIELRHYGDADGRQPFREWFTVQDSQVRARVTMAMSRIEQGNLSNVKSVGAGVLEYRIDFGPGYRIYFGRDGDVVVILLTGGSKKRQQRDIERSHGYWADYKRRKRAAL